MTGPMPPSGSRARGDDLNRDLGFGAVVSEQARERVLNPDGSFNVVRGGLGAFESINPYHTVLSMRWSTLLALLAASYVLLNLLFALFYLACGPGALVMAVPEATEPSRFMTAFNFSVETFATIGYGHIVPVGTAANLLVTLESLVGILSVALATGVIFARFSRPRPRIRFSRYAVIAPYDGISGFMFRIVNERRSELIEVECKVTLTRLETVDGKQTRRYYPLALERDHVTFFPLAWTVVHPIDEKSPLRGETPESLHREQAEFLVLLSGVDDTVSSVVHQRYSYSASEVLWSRRFRSVFVPSTDGRVRIDVGLLHDTEPAELPSPAT